MADSSVFFLFLLSWLLLFPGTQQLQSSQTQDLKQLKTQLEHPKVLEVWNRTMDLCYTPSTPQISVICHENSVTELKIIGDRRVKVSKFDGFPVLGQTLSRDFSIDSFITTLSRLNNLRVVNLISLGIWGPLPDKIHRLNSLEVLELSSNFLYGNVPQKISAMEMLQTLTLDNNFFNETLPDWFDSFKNLSVLSLKNNQLKGSLPPSICRAKTLNVLALSHNEISSNLPDLSGLTSLQVLDLRENKLDSELPVMPKGLVTILLSRNSFSGEISEQFGELDQLQHLDLSFNFLRGMPPGVLFSLPRIRYLNLASNLISGSFPLNLNCSGELGFVDVSDNRLMGAMPLCLSLRSDKRVIRFGGNCLSVDSRHQHKELYCKEFNEQSNGSSGKGTGLLLGVIGGIALLVFVLGLVFVVLCRRYWKREISEQNLLPKPVVDNSPAGFSSELLANARYISQTMKVGMQCLPVYRLFSLEELKESTNNFDQSTYMGEGLIGKLYKGRLENGTYIAIRCLVLFKRYSIRNLKLRLDLLSKLRHPHLVCLLGHCIDVPQDDFSANKVFLVYEYISNGNLTTHISSKFTTENIPDKVLKWPERLAVLIGVAKAVHFLHTGVIPGFFNNRLKMNNILLDGHRIAKLSDYGLSIITEEIGRVEAKGEGHKSCQAEIRSHAWQITNLEDDVYSFGFILLEMLVGASISQRDEASLLNEMLPKIEAGSFSSYDGRKRIVDPIVLTTSAQESLSIMISITNKCLSLESSTRPSIEDVLWNLQYAAQVQATADGDQRSNDSARYID